MEHLFGGKVVDVDELVTVIKDGFGTENVEKSYYLRYDIALEQLLYKKEYTDICEQQKTYAIVEYKNMSGTSFKKTRLQDIKFEQSFLVGANFKNSELIDCTFMNCDLKISDFTGCMLQQVYFMNCDLTEALWKDAVFHDVKVKTGESVKKIYEEKDV